MISARTSQNSLATSPLGELFQLRKEPGVTGLPVLSVTMNDGVVNRDTLDRKDDGKLTPSAHLLIRKGDLAYNMMRMWQGASGLATQDGIVSPAYVVVTPSESIDPTFASYWFKSTRMIHLFWAYSYGITGDRLRLYYKDFARIPVSVPTKNDQVRIGKTLAAADRAIARTEDLIAAKRRLKKALAQKLLSGMARIRGFSGPWTSHKFGDYVSLSKTRFDPKSPHKTCPCIELEHISGGEGRLLATVDSKKQRSIKAVFEKEDVLYGKLRPNLRKSYYCEFDGVCSTEIWVMKTDDQTCCGAYLAELVQTNGFLSAACVTTGTKMPRADWGVVSEVQFALPSVPEQMKIIDVLHVVGRQVDLYKTKLAQFRHLKVGLTQRLLGEAVPKRCHYLW